MSPELIILVPLPHRQATFVGCVPSADKHVVSAAAIASEEHVWPGLAILQIDPVVVQQAHCSVATAPFPLHLRIAVFGTVL